MAAVESITLSLSRTQKQHIRQALLARAQDIRKAARNAELGANPTEASRLHASARDVDALAARFR